MPYRFHILALAACAAAAASAAPAVAFDAERHSVTFTATSTDCGVATPLEFVFVGPGSDHDYEALYVTDADVGEIAAAFDKAGIPRGRPYDLAACRLWPAGVPLEFEPAITSLVVETSGGELPAPVFAGGSRGPGDVPDAATNMPLAVFATYNMAQSLIQFDDSLDQSPTYGRFKPRESPPKGERRTFTVTWKGTPAPERVPLRIEPGKVAEALGALRAKSAAGAPLDVQCDFADALTVREASEAAAALAVVDSPRVKINGATPGQLFYRAYVPLEAWRDRTQRLAQPPEVRFAADGSVKVVEIVEDWSDPGMDDPRLSFKETSCAGVTEAAKAVSPLAERTSTVLVFAPAGMTLAKLHELRRLADASILNWYVFAE